MDMLTFIGSWSWSRAAAAGSVTVRRSRAPGDFSEDMVSQTGHKPVSEGEEGNGSQVVSEMDARRVQVAASRRNVHRAADSNGPAN